MQKLDSSFRMEPPMEEDNEASVETVDDGYYTEADFKRREDMEAEGIASQIWTGEGRRHKFRGGIHQIVRSDLNIIFLLKSLLTQFGIHQSLLKSLLS